MGKAIQFLRGIAILLCCLSVALALTATPGPDGRLPSVALDVLLPWVLSAFQSRSAGVLVPILIGGMFWRATAARELESPTPVAIRLLALQTVLAFLVAEELQFVVAVEAGLLLSPRSGALWVLAQAGAAWLIAALHPDLMSWAIPPNGGSFQRLMGIGIFMLVAMLYNFLAYSLGLLAAVESRQRRILSRNNDELALANRRLQEAQKAVAESARLNERLRLSRELHDAIGHQLSALSINLQIASRLSQDRARRHVLEAYQLTGILLSDVRAVVSATRPDEINDLHSALYAIAERVTQPAIHLDLDAATASLDPGAAHAFFRCAQEVITNAVRHSRASNIWITTAASPSEISMTAWDDGDGNPGLTTGNGLRGIEERIRELAGSCHFENRQPSGFQVAIRLPRKQSAIA